MKTFTAILTLLVSLALLPPTVSADEDFREINLKAGVVVLNVKDGAYDIYSDSDWMTASDIGVEVEAWKELIIQLNCVFGYAESSVYGRYATSLSLIEPQLGVKWGYTFRRFFRPYVSALATYAFMESSLDLPDHRSVGLSDGWADGKWGGRFALGAELFIPRSVFRGSGKKRGIFKDFTLGLAVEFGYKLMQKFDLRMERGGDGVDDDFSVIPGELELGELNLSGFYIAVDFRFYF